MFLIPLLIDKMIATSNSFVFSLISTVAKINTIKPQSIYENCENEQVYFNNFS